MDNFDATAESACDFENGQQCRAGICAAFHVLHAVAAEVHHPEVSKLLRSDTLMGPDKHHPYNVVTAGRDS